MEKSEDGSKNNKIHYVQVQRITNAIKVVEVIGNLKSRSGWMEEE